MKYLLLVVLLYFFAICIQPVSAHVLKVDGSIGAVIHIDPNDGPIIGQASTVYFEIKDKQNLFKNSECDCELEVKKEGESIVRTTLRDGLTTVTFPSKGVYELNLVGKSVSTPGFQPFTLRYDLRVVNESTNAVSPLITYAALFVISMLVVSLGVFLLKKSKLSL